jgi:23S rRNA (guanosine2251-2'-O)-methyltransferase
MTHDNAAEENGVMAKISCGGIEIIPIIRVTNLRGAIDTLKKKGFWILGFDGGAKDFISQKALSGKIGIVLGSEGVGMRRLTTESCDLLLKIPIESSMESINVSNAAAIVFYEAYKNN